VRLRSRKAPRREGRKTSFNDGKKKRKRKRRQSGDDDEETSDDLHDMSWKKFVPLYQAVMERSYLHLSLRSLVGQLLSPGEVDLLVKSSVFVEEDDRENPSAGVRERLKRSAWVRWLLSPSGPSSPYTREVADLVERGSDRADVLGRLADGPGDRVEKAADIFHGNVVNCVCSWPDCPWLTHTLGSPEQRSCAWLCANAVRYAV
jgi:hypothetical protein